MKKTTLIILCFSLFGKMLLSQNWYEQYYHTNNVFSSVNCQLKISTSDFLIAGTTLDSNATHTLLTINRFYGENGPNSVWYKRYDLGYNAEPSKIVKLSDGNYLIAGTLSPLNTYSKIFALKINSSGTVLWSKTYSANYGATVADILVDGANTVMVGTTILNQTTAKTDIYFLKISNTGSVVTKKNFGTSSLDEIPFCISKGNTGEYLIAGAQENKSILIRVNTSGTVLMSKKYNLSSWADRIKGIKYVNSNTIYLIGNINYPRDNYGDMFILKVNNSGTVLSKKAYSLQMNLDNIAYNGNNTAIVGKTDITAGQNGFKLIIFDANFNVLNSNHFSSINNNGAMQTLISTKKTDRYYITVKSPQVNGANTYHVIANENGYGCSSVSFTPNTLTINPTVSTLTFTSASNGTSNSTITTYENKSYRLTFSCEVIVDNHLALIPSETKSVEYTQTEENKTIVYPTNTLGQVHIKSGLNNYLINVYDVFGKLVFSQKNNSSDAELNVEQLNNGLYLLNVVGDNGQKETFRIIKSN